MLGLDGSEHPRLVGSAHQSDFDAALAQWKLGHDSSVDPTFALSSQGGLFGRTCRFVAGTLPTSSAWVAPTAPSLSSAPKRKVKLSTVINQADDNEVEMLDQVRVTAIAVTAKRRKTQRQRMSRILKTSQPYYTIRGE